MPNPEPVQPIDEARFTHALDQWIAHRPEPAPSLKGLVLRLRPKLVQARAKGMTYRQLAAFMAEQGVPCSVSTLKTHLATKRTKKGRPAERTTNRSAPGRTGNIARPALVISSVAARQPGVKGGITDDEI